MGGGEAADDETAARSGGVDVEGEVIATTGLAAAEAVDGTCTRIVGGDGRGLPGRGWREATAIASSSNAAVALGGSGCGG